MKVQKNQQVSGIMSIPEFYAEKSVFVTGGMGFLGKVLVEKLLRSCPDIEHIYMLCRSKKGKNVSERLEELTSSPVFDTIRERNPQALNKIILIQGDVAMLELGISKEDQEILKQKVSIVLHSAATVNFHEPLKVAVNTNLRSMRELMNLSREMKNLKSFVHISTSYINWFDLDCKEEIRQTEHDPNEIIKMCENNSDEILNKLTPKLLGKHRNTYTFTKSLAEKLVADELNGLPIAIVRPSMVGASVSDPKPGWIDSYGSTTVFMYLLGRGAYRSTTYRKEHPFDVIPVDWVINITLAASWKAALDKISNPSAKFPLIYNSTTGSVNAITLKTFVYETRDNARLNPLNDVSWYPKIRLHTTKLANELDLFFTHLIPAYLMDLSAKLTGRKSKAVKMQKSIEKAYKSVEYAVTEPYIFRASNYTSILSQMSPIDKKIFPFDPKAINWKTYLADYHLGIKNYLTKAKPVDPAILKAKMTKLKYLSSIVTISTAAISMYIIGKAGKHLIGNRSDKSVDDFEKTLNNDFSKEWLPKIAIGKIFSISANEK